MSEPVDYTTLWYAALESECGIAIPTEDIKLLRADLYKARELAGDPELDNVIMVTPANGKEVWLCRKEQMSLSEKLP